MSETDPREGSGGVRDQRVAGSGVRRETGLCTGSGHVPDRPMFGIGAMSWIGRCAGSDPWEKIWGAKGASW